MIYNGVVNNGAGAGAPLILIWGNLLGVGQSGGESSYYCFIIFFMGEGASSFSRVVRSLPVRRLRCAMVGVD